MEGVLPYEVFHDNTLKAMATHFPTSEESFSLMPGVGSASAEKYADAFLPIIRAYFKKHGVDSVKSKTETPNTPETASEEPNEYAPELFERLREKRKTIAEEEGVSAFVIFWNKTLEAMATFFPQTKEEFMQIHRVTPAKADKYADVFLPIIRDYCKAHGIPEILRCFVNYGRGIFKSLQIFATSDSEISLCLGTEVEVLIPRTEFPHRECRPPSRTK